MKLTVCSKCSGNENKSCERPDKSINDASLDALSTIKNLRLRSVNKVIIDSININSLPNKFEQLKKLVIKHNGLCYYKNET